MNDPPLTLSSAPFFALRSSTECRLDNIGAFRGSALACFDPYFWTQSGRIWKAPLASFTGTIPAPESNFTAASHFSLEEKSIDEILLLVPETPCVPDISTIITSVHMMISNCRSTLTKRQGALPPTTIPVRFRRATGIVGYQGVRNL